MGLREWIASVSPFRPRNLDDVANLTPAEFARFLDGHGLRSTAAGVSVTPEVAARAIPVKAACTVMAGGVVSMPLRIYRRTVDAGQFVQAPADNHDYWWLLNEQPNEDETAALMWQRVVWDLQLRARSFVRLVRAQGGLASRIVALRYLPRSMVTPERKWDPVQRAWRVVNYAVNDGGKVYGVLPADMLDFRGEVSQENPAHSAQLEAGREAIAILLSIEQFAGALFKNGGTPRTNIEYPQGVNLTEAQADELRAAWVRRYGGADNGAMPLVLTNGGKANKLTWSAEELQMLEAWRFQVSNIARAFNVPPFMIGETSTTSSWGSGIEQMSKGFVRYTLGPTLTAIEQELNRKIFSTIRHYVDFDETALDRGDMKSLGDWYRQAIGGSMGPGFMTVNEVRRRMNLGPVAGGDAIFDPKNGASNDEASDAGDPPPGNAGAEPDAAAAV